jgi:predicted O-methyltransferase YrrM
MTPLVALKKSIRSGLKVDEAAVLRHLAKDRAVLELGSWFGFSTVVMAEVAKRVDAIDWHGGDPIVGHEVTLPVMWGNLLKYGVRDRVVVHVGRNADILPRMTPGQFDFAFHDSYHAKESVLGDVAMMLPLLKPGSLIAFHDYGVHKEHFGVTEAVAELGFRQVSLTKSLVVVRT